MGRSSFCFTLFTHKVLKYLQTLGFIVYTVSGAVRPAGGCCVLRTRWGATLPKPHVRQQRQNIRFASIPFPLAYTPRQ
jgi:hypothetical protein